MRKIGGYKFTAFGYNSLMLRKIVKNSFSLLGIELRLKGSPTVKELALDGLPAPIY